MCLSLLINPSVIYLFVCLVCKMSGNHFLKKPIKHSCIPGLLVLSDQQPETKKNISFTMIQNRKKRHMFAFKELEAIKSRVNDLMQIKMVYLYAINQLVSFSIKHLVSYQLFGWFKGCQVGLCLCWALMNNCFPLWNVRGADFLLTSLKEKKRKEGGEKKNLLPVSGLSLSLCSCEIWNW